MPATYRLAVLADIHGNLPAFQAVMADLDLQGPVDRILVAGDMICGPDQSAVLQELLGRDAIMIQGNNDSAVARIAAGTAPPYVYTAKQFSLRRWSCEHLTREEIAFISALPEQRVVSLPGADPIRMVHGSPDSINELVIPPDCGISRAQITRMVPDYNPNRLAEILQAASEPVLIFGHTHLPWHAWIDQRLAINPGAVCFPENGYIGAQYAILTWDGARWLPEFHAVRYDMEAARRAHEMSGFSDTGPLARIFLREMLTGKDILPDFFGLAEQLAKEAGMESLPYIPDSIWDQVGAVFDRKIMEQVPKE